MCHEIFKQILKNLLILSAAYSTFTFADSTLQKPQNRVVYCKKVVIDRSADVLVSGAGTQLDCKRIGPEYVPVGIRNGALGQGRFSQTYTWDAWFDGALQNQPYASNTAFFNQLNPMQLICAPRRIAFFPGACTE